MFYTGVKKMNNKIFIILFFLFALISVSAVSAADADGNNDTIVSSANAEILSAANDVNAIDDLNKDDSGSEAVLGNAVKSSVAGEKEILSAENSGSEVLGATGTTITSVNVQVVKYGADPVLDVAGFVHDSNGGGISKGTVSVCLNDKVYATLTPFGVMGYISTQVIVTPGSYNLVLRYHDGSGEYKDCEYVYGGNPIVIASTWYVDGSKSSSGNGKSDEEAFVTLAEALTAANDGDKIKIAAGTYTGSGNIGLTVDKNLTFEKYGDGEAIFDAQGQGRILNVNANSMNITGLTFKNGKVSGPGAAISFNSKLSNSVIIAKFINNSARYGGAIYLWHDGSNLVINSTFENNVATGRGGAISIAKVSNSVINSTFENNNATSGGGAIYCNMVSDSLINSIFKNNSAERGGAIRFDGNFTKSNLTSVFINNIASADGGANCFNFVNNVNIIGDFINNTAKGSGGEYGGGANAFYYTMTNVSISGNFIGNSATGSDATDGGAANYFLGEISNVNITGKFINNTGNNVIYILKDSGNNYIQDSVFLNNDVNHIINVTDGKITAKDNWFGNNYTNFMNEPENVGIDLVNWLFLYAEPPFMFDVGQSSQITFGLIAIDSNYNGYPYDASKMNITLDLSQTLGELDKTSALIGEEITYTAKKGGNATVTGKFETASNTVSFTINDPRIPTEIKIANSTVNLKANDEIESGATLTPAGAGNVTYTSSNSSVAVVVNGKIKALAAGSANITVSFAGNDTYAAAENKTIVVNVALADASVSVNNDTLDLLVKGTFDLEATTVPSGLNVSYSSTNESVVTVNSDGKVTAVGAGNATIVVTVGDDKVYAINSTNVSVNVKIPTAIDDILIPELRVGNKFTLRYILVDSNTGSTIRENLEYTVTSTNESVVKAYIDRGIVIECVGEGNANVTAGFAGNDKYAAAENKTFTLTVNKVPTGIKIANSTVDMKVKEEIESGATLNPTSAGNVTYTSSNSSVAIVKDDKIIAVGEGSANITVSFAGDNKYATAENKTIEVNVSLNEAKWTYLDMHDVESPLDQHIIWLPWNYHPICFVKDADGVPLPVGTKITLLCEGDENYVLNTTTEENGQFTVDLSNVRPGKYNVTFSTEAYTTATATITLLKVPTEISVANSTVDLKANDDIDVGATLTPADAGNLTYTSSNSSVAVVENGKIKALAAGTANITVSFVANDKYYSAENKTIEVTVTLNDASVAAEDITLDIGANATIAATTTPEGLEVDYTPDKSGVVTVEDGVVTGVKVGTAKVTLTVGGDGVYAENSTTITVTVKKIDTTILAEESLELTIGSNDTVLVVIEPISANLNATFASSNPSIVTVDDDGNVKAVGVGNATITVSYAGDDKYNAAENVTVAVTVKDPKQNATMDIVTGEVVEDENSTITVNLPEDATGNVTAVVEGEEYTAPVVNGTANIAVPGLRPGNYSVPVTYSGDDKYNPATEKITYNVEEVDKSDIISAPDVTKYFNGPERFVVNITDYKGNPVANRSVSIVINGKEYNRTTDTNGTASIALGLNSGVYNATVTVGNETLNPVVTVLSTVNGTDVVKVYRNDTQYYATFRDSEGNYLKDGTAVRFNINGVMYDRKISGSEGLAKLNINLNQGNYVITAINLETGENAANNITIISRLVENSDITKYYRNATQYTVKVIGDDGNPVGAGETVTFNINGVFYNRTTNASGIAKLNINLPPGDYIITAEYKNCKVSNDIKVLPVLSAEDLTKKYGTPDQFVATLLDGQGKALAGETVQFNVNGVLYNRVTDSDGHAKLNIRLMAGQYIITSSYNGASIANNIVITA